MSNKNRGTDLTGMQFGMLKVLRQDIEHSQHERRWICECQCNAKNIVSRKTSNLLSTSESSCGCLKNDRMRKEALSRQKHGLSKTRLFGVWHNMKGRCFNPTDKQYKWYGLRGISVCDEWKDDFLRFYRWSIDNGYAEGMSIDRINVNGNYEPNNCRWVPVNQQARNKRNVPLHDYNGELITGPEFARKYGMTDKFVYSRLKSGKSFEDMIAEWNLSKNIPTDYIELKEYAKIRGVSMGYVRRKIKRDGFDVTKICGKTYVITKNFELKGE